MWGYGIRALTGRTALTRLMRTHFAGIPLERIVTANRSFPPASRVDVQVALDGMLSGRSGVKLFGVHSPLDNQQSPALAQLFAPGPFPVDVGPLEHDEVDIGDPTPARCLRVGLWIAREGNVPFAVLLARQAQFGHLGNINVELGVPAGEREAEFSQLFFRDLERRVGEGRTYRGRVISLEVQPDYSGRGGSVKVHRLRQVQRDEVILPARTLALLDRNISRFVEARDGLKMLRFSAKKGVLFYGAAGTGKTHTIHYLASQLPHHTTLLVTAEQAFFIDEYFRLARFLQPAMMVIEDVDLIAREREHMHHPGQESLLNKLLNEMDGLREDADVLFVLTTNRPEALEPALASRPGRIDQAIEFPLPDADGRRRLVALYSRGLDVPPGVLDLIVRRTDGASPAFIKELLRRCAQLQIERRDSDVLRPESVDAAIEEMVFAGGALNLKLLGGSSELGASLAADGPGSGDD